MLVANDMPPAGSLRPCCLPLNPGRHLPADAGNFFISRARK